MPVMSVLGWVEPTDLGVVAPHEHLLVDASIWWRPPSDPSLRKFAEGPIELGIRGLLYRNQWLNRLNMTLDEEELAIAELRRFHTAGGGTLVDLTPTGIGRDPDALVRISRETGVTVVCGTSFYIEEVHPAWVATAATEDLAAHFIRELTIGIDDTGVRAGIIGELGTSQRVTGSEERVLRAAAVAQQEAGCAINVHVDIFGRESGRILTILEDAGADLERVILSHWDHHDLDLDEQRAALALGAVVEYDGFGRESYLDEIGHHWARDTERVAGIAALVREGYGRQLLLSSDICLKTDLRAYGGLGYDHVLVSIVPELRRSGIDEQQINQLLVTNPARLLTIPAERNQGQPTSEHAALPQ